MTAKKFWSFGRRRTRRWSSTRSRWTKSMELLFPSSWSRPETTLPPAPAKKRQRPGRKCSTSSRSSSSPVLTLLQTDAKTERLRLDPLLLQCRPHRHCRRLWRFKRSLELDPGYVSRSFQGLSTALKDGCCSSRRMMIRDNAINFLLLRLMLLLVKCGETLMWDLRHLSSMFYLEADVMYKF